MTLHNLTPQNLSPEPNHTSKQKLYVYTISGICFLCVIAFFAFFLLNNTNKKSTVDEGETPSTTPQEEHKTDKTTVEETTHKTEHSTLNRLSDQDKVNNFIKEQSGTYRTVHDIVSLQDWSRMTGMEFSNYSYWSDPNIYAIFRTNDESFLQEETWREFFTNNMPASDGRAGSTHFRFGGLSGTNVRGTHVKTRTKEFPCVSETMALDLMKNTQYEPPTKKIYIYRQIDNMTASWYIDDIYHNSDIHEDGSGCSAIISTHVPFEILVVVERPKEMRNVFRVDDLEVGTMVGDMTVTDINYKFTPMNTEPKISHYNFAIDFSGEVNLDGYFRDVNYILMLAPEDREGLGFDFVATNPNDLPVSETSGYDRWICLLNSPEEIYTMMDEAGVNKDEPVSILISRFVTHRYRTYKPEPCFDYIRVESISPR